MTNVTINAQNTKCCGLALLSYTEAELTNCDIHTNSWYCIANNGADSEVKLTINGGTYTADDCTAIYLPNYNATTTISSATITGAAGIEIRGGTLTLNDCTVSGTNASYDYQSNGSGNTVYGPAIAISQHTTKKNINVTINGGTYTATNAPAVAQLNLNSASSDDVSKISLTIVDGEFTGYSADENNDTAIELASVETDDSTDNDVTGMSVSVTGGTYSSDVSSYVADGCTTTTDEDGNTIVTTQTEKQEDSVASVTSSDGTTTVYYTSLSNALNAATSGATVTLLNSVTLNESLIYDNEASVILELNGNTITFAYNGDDGTFNGETLTDGAWGLKVASGTLTIQDNSTAGTGTITASDTDTYVDVVVASNNATLNIKSGNFTTNSIYEAVVFATSSATVNISGGTFTNDATSYQYNSTFTAGLTLNIGNGSNATISVTGGTFVGRSPADGDDATASVTTFVAEGYEATDNGDGSYTVAEATVAVAYTDDEENGTYYSTFDEVVADIDSGTITDGMTIKLLDNATWTLTANKTITIGLTFDLNGKTLTLDGNYYVQFNPSSSNSTVAFIDSSYNETDAELTGKVLGAYNSTSNAMICISKSCTVALENVYFENTANGYVMEIGTSGGQAINLTAENCSFVNSTTDTKSYGMRLYGNSASATGKLSLQDCTFETSSTSTSGAALLIQYGKSATASVIEIKDCMITGNGTTTSSYALNLSSSLNSKVTVTGSTISAPNGACAVFFNYSINSAADITFGDENMVTGQVRFGNASSPTYLINVTGGCFSYKVDNDVVPFVAASDAVSAMPVVNLLNLTGGYFMVDVSGYVASGYICVANTEDAAGESYNKAYAEAGYGYTVIAATGIKDFYVKAADGSVTYYDSLSAALNASSSNSTVYFAADCTLTDSDISIINSKGCTVTNYGSATLTYGGMLLALVTRLTNGTIDVTTLAYQYDESTTHTMTNAVIANGILTSGLFPDMKSNNIDILNYYTADGLLTGDYVLCNGSYGWQVGSATDSYVAQVDGKAYFAMSKLGAAFTLAGGLNDSDGEAHTVTLLADTTYDLEMSAATAGRKLILDLGGKTLTGHVYLLANNLTVTIQNGTISNNDSQDYAICTNGTYTGDSLTLNNVTVENTDGYAMYLPADGATTITNCTITGVQAGIEIRAGSLTVENSTVTATNTEFGTQNNGSGTTVYGAGIAVSQHTTNKEITVNIADSKISGYYGIYEINYNSSNTNTVTINISEDAEDATVVKATGSGAAAVYSVSISGADDEEITATTNERTTIAISGGHFSTDLANTPEYIADGYAAYTETDEITYAGKLYTVGTAVASVTTTDGVTTYYATITDALAAATSGSTITLLADVTVDEAAEIKTSVTLDLNGKNFTVGSENDADPVSLTIAEGATVSIVDKGTGGIVYNYGTITVNGTLDISTLGYTTDATSGGGLFGQTNGKTAMGENGTFIVPSVWETMWTSSMGENWSPNWPSATGVNGIFSSAAEGATVVCNGTIWTCTAAFENLTEDPTTPCWTLKTDYAKLKTRTLTLDGSIGMNYYVNPNGATDMENYSVRFTVGSDVTTVAYNADAYRTDLSTDGTTYYRFTVYVTSVQMATSFTAALLYKGTVIQSNSCSVQEYCDYMIEHSSDQSLKDLCAALLNYGGYAQTYFDENTDKMANANLKTSISNWNDPVLNSWLDENVSSYEASVSSTLPSEIAEDTNGNHFNVTLLMESQTVIRIYFNLSDGSDTSALTFTVDEEELEIKTTTASDTGHGKYDYYVEFKVAANELSTSYTFSVTGSNAEEDGSITYSALAYVNTCVTKSSDTNLKNVCKALYYYSAAADVYSDWK